MSHARPAEEEGAPLAQQALKDGLEVVICGDFNDYDGVTLDEQHNVPVSRVLAMLQDTDGDGSRELQMQLVEIGIPAHDIPLLVAGRP